VSEHTEFDRVGGRYDELVARSISFSGRDRGFFLQAKAERLLALARRLGDPADLRVLDVGCGDGQLDALLGQLRGLEGTDVSPEMVELARRANPAVPYRVGDEARLPYEDASFDFVFTVCVVHHVPPPARPAFFNELARVARSGGLTAVVEHNPFNPLTRLAVARCEFDEDAKLVRPREAASRLLDAGLRPADVSHFLFFPWRGGAWARLERVLRRIPLGAQYYVAATKGAAEPGL
jgi:SAM-dependent methyltransferase